MKEKVLVIGSRSDLAKNFISSTNKYKFIEINSDFLNLKNPELDKLNKCHYF